MNTNLPVVSLIVVAAILCCPATTHAASKAERAGGAADFVEQAAWSDMFELQASELAAVKGEPRTRAFAAMMNAAHQKTSSELGLIVKGHAEDLPLPPRLDPVHQKEIDGLNSLEGDAFTARYQRDQVEAHRRAIVLFEGFASNGSNEALRQWAASTLPKLERHLEEARALSSSEHGSRQLKIPVIQ